MKKDNQILCDSCNQSILSNEYIADNNFKTDHHKACRILDSTREINDNVLKEAASIKGAVTFLVIIKVLEIITSYLWR